jgi:hypothetical protein
MTLLGAPAVLSLPNEGLQGFAVAVLVVIIPEGHQLLSNGVDYDGVIDAGICQRLVQ